MCVDWTLFPFNTPSYVLVHRPPTSTRSSKAANPRPRWRRQQQQQQQAVAGQQQRQQQRRQQQQQQQRQQQQRQWWVVVTKKATQVLSQLPAACSPHPPLLGR